MASFSLFSPPEDGIWHLMQVVYLGENLCEVSGKYVCVCVCVCGGGDICWICPYVLDICKNHVSEAILKISKTDVL